jgi:hypothetical protein
MAKNLQLMDTLRGRDRASLEMRLKMEIEFTQRCTGRPWPREIGDTLRGRGRVN